MPKCSAKGQFWEGSWEICKKTERSACWILRKLLSMFSVKEVARVLGRMGGWREV